MVYLYAGLGVMMLSGIMAIFEMGLAVTGQSLFEFESEYHASNYFNSDLTEKDKDIDLIDDLLDGTWRKNFIAENPGVTINCENYHEYGDYSWESVAGDRCVSKRDGRRILVDIDSDKVYICFPEKSSDTCSFEEKS